MELKLSLFQQVSSSPLFNLESIYKFNFLALCGEFNAKVTIVSRAYENSVYVCYVNRVGEELCPDWKENGSSFQTTLKFIGLSVVGIFFSSFL